VSVLHLDSAAAGRPTTVTVDAVVAHLHREVELGAYVAEEEAAGLLSGLRADVAGILGAEPDGVAFVESATAGLDALLGAWPLATGDVIGVVPSEWGQNLEAFAHRGLTATMLATDETGQLDLDRLRLRLETDPPAVVHLCAAASHRGLAQPVDRALALCREYDVALWVDAAQSFGQLAPTVMPDAVYANSRKWMRGPRGVGFLAVDTRHWGRLRVRGTAKHPEQPIVACLASGEANVAGRVGLATAVRSYLEHGPDRVAKELAALGERSRAVLSELHGWRLVDNFAGATTSLAPTEGQDPVAVRARLLREHGILTTALLPWRAPHEVTEPWLRISPHLDVTDADLDRLARTLTTI